MKHGGRVKISPYHYYLPLVVLGSIVLFVPLQRYVQLKVTKIPIIGSAADGPVGLLTDQKTLGPRCSMSVKNSVVNKWREK